MWGALSDEGGCHLQLLLVLASAVILGSEFLIRDSPNLGVRYPYLNPPRNRVAQLYPQVLGPLFVASYDSQGYGGSIRTRLHTSFLLAI
jgi:hypothetical protein